MKTCSVKNTLIFMCVLLLCSCASYQSPPTLMPTPMMKKDATFFVPTNSPLPAVIKNVFPDDMINLSKYEASLQNTVSLNRGINVTVVVDRNRINDGSFRLDVDGKQLPNWDSIEDGLEMNGPFTLTWTPTLDSGWHEATFELIYGDGESLKYTWRFVITED